MHELGLAMEIVAIAGEEAAKAGARRIEAVHLRLSANAGGVKEALLLSRPDSVAIGRKFEGQAGVALLELPRIC